MQAHLPAVAASVAGRVRAGTVVLSALAGVGARRIEALIPGCAAIAPRRALSERWAEAFAALDADAFAASAVVRRTADAMVAACPLWGGEAARGGAPFEEDPDAVGQIFEAVAAGCAAAGIAHDAARAVAAAEMLGGGDGGAPTEGAARDAFIAVYADLLRGGA